MKPKVLARLNLAWIIVFLILLIVILIAVDPFQANTFLIVLFYVVFFGFILGVLHLIRMRFKIPFWIILLISIAIVFLLTFQSFKF